MNLRKESRLSQICHTDHASFDHFLLTRFAVYGPGGEIPDDMWLKDRFKLFEDYCLPSVRNQTCQVFRWGLLVSPEFPAWARERLLGLGFKSKDLIVSHDWRSATASAAWIHAHSANNSILTTRLDNDDALASNFMERLHTKVSFNKHCAYNFSHGLQLTAKGVLLTSHQSNPFLSLAERRAAQIRSVLDCDHDEAKHHWNVVQIKGVPGWLQVIHDDNVSNVASGLPFGSRWATRLFVLPCAVRNYPVPEFLRDLHPLQVLWRRLRRTLQRLI